MKYHKRLILYIYKLKNIILDLKLYENLKKFSGVFLPDYAFLVGREKILTNIDILRFRGNFL